MKSNAEWCPGLKKQALALISSVIIEVVRLSNDISVVTLPTICLTINKKYGCFLDMPSKTGMVRC
ncbi:hypothetical protein EJB05_28076, partial [Eragrostis curvula]